MGRVRLLCQSPIAYAHHPKQLFSGFKHATVEYLLGPGLP